MLCWHMHYSVRRCPWHCGHLHKSCVRHNAAEHARLSALRTHNKHALHAQAFKGLGSLILSTAISATTTEGGSPLCLGIGYEGPDLERSQKPTEARLQAVAVLQQAVLHVGDAPCKHPQDFLDFVRNGIGKTFCGKASTSASYAGFQVLHTGCSCLPAAVGHAGHSCGTIKKHDWNSVGADV